MKVVMNVSIAGLPEPKYGLLKPFSFAVGDTVDLDPALAQAWLANGHASPASADSAAKAASKGAAKTAGAGAAA